MWSMKCCSERWYAGAGQFSIRSLGGIRHEDSRAIHCPQFVAFYPVSPPLRAYRGISLFLWLPYNHQLFNLFRLSSSIPQNWGKGNNKPRMHLWCNRGDYYALWIHDSYWYIHHFYTTLVWWLVKRHGVLWFWKFAKPPWYGVISEQMELHWQAKLGIRFRYRVSCMSNLLWKCIYEVVLACFGVVGNSKPI